VGSDTLDRIRQAAQDDVTTAAERALAWPDPSLDQRLDDVWTTI